MVATILQRNKLFPTLARSTPKLVIIFAFLNCMLEPTNNTFYVLGVVLLSSVLNIIFKYIVAKPIYKLFRTNDLPVLGIGSRPPGATSCGTYINGKLSTSFGMPSGHSQIAWTIGTYLICRLINKMVDDNYITTSNKILLYIWYCISISILIIFMIYISYSRVYIEGCHTIQQVIVGSIIGGVYGFLAFYFEKSILTGMKLMN
jgi:membrane-associated phospholipid phosphatase